MSTTQESTTKLRIGALHTFWDRTLHGDSSSEAVSWDVQKTLLAGLGLNHLEALRYLRMQRPTFEAFEAWIVAQRDDAFAESERDRLRRALDGHAVGSPIGALDAVEGLSEAELAQWDEHGYVIVRNAVSTEAAETAEMAIYEHLGMSRDDPESWYSETLGHTIWVPLLRHPALVANRFAPRVVKAFAQLWGREDLWATVDQAGLNPPERPGWLFPGPKLHWDCTLAQPHHLEIQGILYLAETEAAQGAFCCVPGFHKGLIPWLDSLPKGADPRAEALRTLTAKPIAAGRGDLVLWHQSLPHGSSPNRASRPRVVQYISMRPTRWEHNSEWI
ncbi:Ectoine hydroxylase-related dioxygenase, phytanoyl-CoA dioxygenase (PhyH) family [Granulicella pectinivorans]|uniref:Ectoine hydroxylase-related dioxygenase, phytanoyl-CoA dioxygenase (PhyH) family n=1 Tax=Granulicella pectinivorans TaxID=474950 RepID=A0A1I6LGI2_9BACT|nr:phytanoyl-CoA dioxygenase family protein [Granulicella pectinivorans]SFS02551.1 Ectoine hydroxylase-related dioxygenase, phytanoyl-CoA dioxygenase (PhyH) family [Granulicella pectinivorans]